MQNKMDIHLQIRESERQRGFVQANVGNLATKIKSLVSSANVSPVQDGDGAAARCAELNCKGPFVILLNNIINIRLIL